MTSTVHFRIELSDGCVFDPARIAGNCGCVGAGVAFLEGTHSEERARDHTMALLRSLDGLLRDGCPLPILEPMPGHMRVLTGHREAETVTMVPVAGARFSWTEQPAVPCHGRARPIALPQTFTAGGTMLIRSLRTASDIIPGDLATEASHLTNAGESWDACMVTDPSIDGGHAWVLFTRDTVAVVTTGDTIRLPRRPCDARTEIAQALVDAGVTVDC